MRAGPSGENRMLTHGGSVVLSVQPWEAYLRITVEKTSTGCGAERVPFNFELLE
jgi:hypothetical protein